MNNRLVGVELNIIRMNTETVWSVAPYTSKQCQVFQAYMASDKNREAGMSQVLEDQKLLQERFPNDTIEIID